jgi:UDP-N-acetylglucosamine 2-epimerase (non-hydrolysing)
MQKSKKIGVVLGTRPCIIKLSPVIRYLEKNKMDYFVVHTGQHYSYELDKIFFEELNLPQPKYFLNIRSLSPYQQGTHTGQILIDMEKIFLKELPNTVIVHGDTNSALAGALLASKITTTKDYTGFCIKIAHVEAGLRSYDRSMPEEINRVICDHLSDYLFSPTKGTKENLKKEGIIENRIYVVGNTIVDAVFQNLEISNKKKNILEKLNLKPKEYVVVTAHRQENVDSKIKFQNILNAISQIKNKFGLKVIYPMHPRTKDRILKFNLQLPSDVEIIDAQGFLEFLQLEANARLLITDSGGIQEEGCILKVPCVTLRDNTERPETIDVGGNILSGTDKNKILDCINTMLNTKINWFNPFGDGTTSNQIIDIIMKQKK